MLTRSGWIDTLRGLSILSVVIRHIDIRLPFSKTPWADYLPESLLRLFVSGGGYGVRIFFVISGFLITSTSLKRWGALEQMDARAFYRFRFARIGPCFLALLVIISALHLLGVKGYVIDPARATLGEAWFAALGLHVNWLEAQRGYLPANWDVLWTLSIEELFYLVFPILGLSFKRPAALVVVWLALIACGPFARTVWSSNDYWQSKSYLSCMDGIAMGCLAAMVPREALSVAVREASFFIGMVVISAILFFDVRLGHGLTATGLALGTALTLLGQPKWNGWGLFRYFGRNSYEVYLSHMFVVLTASRLLNGSNASFVWAPFWYIGMLLASGLLGDCIRVRFSEPLNLRLRSPRPF